MRPGRLTEARTGSGPPRRGPPASRRPPLGQLEQALSEPPPLEVHRSSEGQRGGEGEDGKGPSSAVGEGGTRAA